MRIYEQRYAMLHAKSMVIDSALSMVGSANFDIRSFLLQLQSWRKRPWLDRFKELTSSLFSYGL